MMNSITQTIENGQVLLGWKWKWKWVLKYESEYSC